MNSPSSLSPEERAFEAWKKTAVEFLSDIPTNDAKKDCHKHSWHFLPAMPQVIYQRSNSPDRQWRAIAYDPIKKLLLTSSFSWRK